MSRHFRQAKILELIERVPIQTQESLANALRESGFKITQATVSRDIKELSLVKIPYGNRQRYSRGSDAISMLQKVKEVFKLSVLSYEYVDMFVVLKTIPGMASSAVQLIKQHRLDEIACAISQDDTVLVLTRNREDRDSLMKIFDALIND